MKKITYAIFTLVTVLAMFTGIFPEIPGHAANEPNIPPDAVTYNGNSYAVFDTSMTWTDAEAYCESLGGHLATITSPDEQSVIESILAGRQMPAYWLGGYCQSGIWYWVTGENFSYSNWQYDQPDGSGDDMYIQMFVADQGSTMYAWDDTWNTGDRGGGIRTHGIVCEWGANISGDAIAAQTNQNADLDKLLGAYTGTYTANQGITGLNLVVEKNNGVYSALFSFYPVAENKNVESGSYRMSVSYDGNSGIYSLTGTEWVVKAPSYVFADLKGTLSGNVFTGNVLDNASYGGSIVGKFELFTDASGIGTPAYIYDEADPGATVAPPYDKLDNITGQSSAMHAVTDYINTLTSAQKQSPTGADRVALFCEAAIARVASTTVSGDIVIDKALVTDLQSQAEATKAALQSTLDSGGVLNLRDLRTTVTVDYNGSSTANISVNSDYSDADADVVKVDAGFASLYMNKGQVATTDITLQNQGANKVGVDFSNTNSKSIVTVSFPNADASDEYAAVVDGSGAAVGGKYNPATNSIEARISGSGTYTVKDNPKDFADIKNKSAEMQSAIKLLASKGIINGTSDTAFSPDATISRAEVAALIIRMLGRLDPNADGGFSDVARSAWYYGVAGSSRDYGLINGYEDNTFRAAVTIPKDQIFAVAARVLRQEMGYATPADVNKYLPYSDASSIPAWARDDLAVATMANLVMRRTDGTFDPNEQMTRGDAAIGVMRLYEKIW